MSRVCPPLMATLSRPRRACLFSGPNTSKPKLLAASSSLALPAASLQTRSMSLVTSLRPYSSMAAPPMTRNWTGSLNCSPRPFNISSCGIALDMLSPQDRPDALHHGMLGIFQFISVLQVKQYTKEPLAVVFCGVQRMNEDLPNGKLPFGQGVVVVPQAQL